MRVHLIAVGTRMPEWVESAYRDYARRLPPEFQPVLHEIPAGKRGKNIPVERAIEQEARAMEKILPRDCLRIVLDERGKQWTTDDLAAHMREWPAARRDVALLVGGPDGLHPDIRAGAERLWALSKLTLPHPLVRVLLAEQLYRAWSINSNHPYHRAG